MGGENTVPGARGAARQAWPSACLRNFFSGWLTDCPAPVFGSSHRRTESDQPCSPPRLSPPWACASRRCLQCRIHVPANEWDPTAKAAPTLYTRRPWITLSGRPGYNILRHQCRRRSAAIETRGRRSGIDVRGLFGWMQDRTESASSGRGAATRCCAIACAHRPPSTADIKCMRGGRWTVIAWTSVVFGKRCSDASHRCLLSLDGKSRGRCGIDRAVPAKQW